MSKPGVFVKLLLANLLAAVLVVASGAMAFHLHARDGYAHRQLQRQQAATRLLQTIVPALWPADGLPSRAVMDAFVKSAGRTLDARIIVIAADGMALGDSQAGPDTMPAQITPAYPEMMAAVEGQTVTVERNEPGIPVPVRHMAAPILRNGQTLGAVRVSMKAEILGLAESPFGAALLWTAVTVFILVSLLALLVGWLWYMPLRRITQTALEMASGNTNTQADVNGSGELAQLGKALNDMRDRLTGDLGAIATQRENLAVVVANLREGVVALDSGRIVVLMNPAAIDLLCPGAPDPRGQHVQKAIRIPTIVDMIDRLDASGGPIAEQLVLKTNGHNRTLHLHVAKVPGDSAAGIRLLIVVRDISEMAQMASMKAEFVANASHELRTPLATIRAAVESLQSIDPKDRESHDKIVAIIERHLARLDAMTSDLLDLHLVEQTRSRLRLENIRLIGLAQWAKLYFTNKAREKQVRFDAKTDGPDAGFSTDHTLLQLILQNLIDNAIKYTPPGGTIELRLRAEAGRIVARVTDTGCGIPREIQQRVFERFFQADPSRSGDTRIRGTGLGLAIVKHAADRLGAEVNLESEPGKGTTITVSMPMQPKNEPNGQ